ncbi:hypothetical protein [Micavibrio aeruginosavorus]|uniref:hypothetical protein n=1 Tax=Micavibrio aeruginosavorus TaxID=349221 RepID=UPI003F4AF2C6
MSLKSRTSHINIKATHTAAPPNYRAILEVDQDTNRPYDLLLAFCRVYDRAESNLRDAWDRHNNQGADIRQVWKAQDRVKLVLEAYDRVSSTAPKPV